MAGKGALRKINDPFIAGLGLERGACDDRTTRQNEIDAQSVRKIIRICCCTSISKAKGIIDHAHGAFIPRLISRRTFPSEERTVWPGKGDQGSLWVH